MHPFTLHMVANGNKWFCNVQYNIAVNFHGTKLLMFTIFQEEIFDIQALPPMLTKFINRFLFSSIGQNL